MGNRVRGKRLIRGGGALAMLVTCVALAMAGGSAGAEPPEPVQISAAPDLVWGFKNSWRVYAGPPETEAGVEVEFDGGYYDLAWEFESGSYDATAGTTELRYEGEVHWRKYNTLEHPNLNNPPPGYSGPAEIDILDVRMSDPVISIGPDSATISVESVSRSRDTWELVDLGRVAVVNLDVTEVVPTVAAGTTTWAGIPALSNEASAPVFAGSYQPGIAVDEVGFSYSGPGGAPDFSESWDAPGSTRLELTANTMITHDATNETYEVLYVDRQRRLIHNRTTLVDADGEFFYKFQAFSLDSTSVVGEPLILPLAQRLGTLTVFDSNSGRLIHRGAIGTPSAGEAKFWLRYDAGLGRYVQGEFPNPIPIVGNPSPLGWDSVGERAFNIRRFVPPGVGSTEYGKHQWQLHLYKRDPAGLWQVETLPLTNLPPHLNQRGYSETFGNTFHSAGLAAPDGSLLVLGTRQTSTDAAQPAPATVPGLWRIEISGGAAHAEPVPGTEVANETSAVWDTIQRGGSNQIALLRQGNAIPNTLRTLDVSASGEVVPDDYTEFDDDEFDMGSYTDGVLALDPVDGTAWVGGDQSQRVLGIKDGRIVANQYFAERSPRGGLMMVGLDHTVYAQSSDGTQPGFGGPSALGIARLARLGWSPTVSADPQSQAVALAAGEDAETVQFRSLASGEPAPERQWQVKAPGATRFADIAGETGETLLVEAVRGMGGRQYRAVYANVAGRIASEAATLTVDYTPEIAVDTVPVEVAEGEDATFQALAVGSPDPALTWQRRVGGFWQAITVDDDNFEIDGGTLTVPATNRDQSGALFRLKAANEVGSAYSSPARLTVTPGLEVPPGGLELDGVSLDWSGSEELQRLAPNGQPSYFSAGVSTGDASTYRASAGGAHVLHEAPGGSLSAASWASRGAQTGGDVTQLVRLSGGSGRIEEDGSAAVRWSGALSVNFYGGLVPFSIASPELEIDAEGRGELRADLSGYGSSMADPSQRFPVAPREDVVVATFSGVAIDPRGEVVVDPHYAGVAVSPPPPFVAQDRLGAGWGAWPQAFVDFHGDTGLAPYWYSSGGAFDAHKGPLPFAVDFGGADDTPPAADGGPSPAAETAVPAGAAPPSADGPSAREKLRPRLALTLVGRKRGHLRLSLRAWVPGATATFPTGQLVVQAGNRIVTVGALRLRDRGRRIVELPRLSSGRHFLRATLSGSARQEEAQTPYRSLRVR